MPQVHPEAGEDQHEDEQVVDAEALLQQVAGGPFPVSYTHLTLPTSDLV